MIAQGQIGRIYHYFDAKANYLEKSYLSKLTMSDISKHQQQNQKVFQIKRRKM